MNPLRIPTTTLWTLDNWRCDVDRLNRLRLFHGETLVAEHGASSLDSAQAYARVWRAAIADLVQPTFRRSSRAVAAAD